MNFIEGWRADVERLLALLTISASNSLPLLWNVS